MGASLGDKPNETIASSATVSERHDRHACRHGEAFAVFHTKALDCDCGSGHLSPVFTCPSPARKTRARRPRHGWQWRRHVCASQTGWGSACACKPVSNWFRICWCLRLDTVCDHHDPQLTLGTMTEASGSSRTTPRERLQSPPSSQHQFLVFTVVRHGAQTHACATRLLVASEPRTWDRDGQQRRLHVEGSHNAKTFTLEATECRLGGAYEDG